MFEKCYANKTDLTGHNDLFYENVTLGGKVLISMLSSGIMPKFL